MKVSDTSDTCYKERMRFAVVLLALAVTACTDAPGSPDAPVDLRVVLAPGAMAVVPGAVVRFEGVFGDSRCPGDAICSWAGDATIRITVLSAGEPSSSYDLHTIDLKPVRHRNLTIALVELSPYPFHSLGAIAPADYRATLRITR